MNEEYEYFNIETYSITTHEVQDDGILWAVSEFSNGRIIQWECNAVINWENSLELDHIQNPVELN